MLSRHRRRSRMLLPVLVLALALGASACGNDDDGAGAGAENDPAAGAETSEAVDMTFVSMMMPHHEMAIQMGEMAAEKGSTAEVKALGRKIADDQKQEMTTLQGLARDVGAEPMTMPPPIQAMDEDMMKRMQAASGTEFDMMFLEDMRMHHAQAISEAEFEIAAGANEDVKALARKIREAQLAEIDQMNGMIARMG